MSGKAPKADLVGGGEGAVAAEEPVGSKSAEFRHLMTHEYVESRLMKGGLPYVYDETGLWRWGDEGECEGRRSPKSLSAAGAHDLAPNPAPSGGASRRCRGMPLRG